MFGDLLNVHTVFDDVIIAGADDSEHDETFNTVLQRTRETVSYTHLTLPTKRIV